MLIIQNPFTVTGQVDTRDTLYVNDSDFDDIINYSARDSIYTDVKNKLVLLYGGAKVKMEQIVLTAGFIQIDLDKNELSAKYRIDSTGNPTEYPEFKDGQQEMVCQEMRYNIKTKKGFIKELNLQQDEFYFQMETAKKHANDEIHLLQGKLTTCDQKEPHYHFQLSKGVIVPEERIATGPMNLWINGIPTPIGLPFALIPDQKKRTHGILFPEMVPTSIYGFGFQNLGYYFPINENLQTSVYANLYSRGSWGIRNDLDYAKRYAFTGRLSLGFQQFRSGFPENQSQNKTTVIWSHRKAPKSNPSWSFSSNVNFISDNQSKNSLDPINPTYFNNSFNSDINLNKSFPGKPINMGLKVSMRQNSLSESISLVSPILTANMTRIFPFKKFIKRSNNEFKKMIERIGFSYNFDGQNRSNFSDSLLIQGDFSRISDQFMYGMKQSMTIQTTGALFKNILKITPSAFYASKLNFQEISKSYNAIDNNTQIDTLKRTSLSHEFNLNVNATTMLYTYFDFIGKKKAKMRHIMTPTVGYRYVPELNPLTVVNAGVDQSTISYSPFERSLYTVANTTESSFLTFAINNTLELKFKSDEDTVTGFKKMRILDQFSIVGNYNFKKDSMKLSNINLNMRISPKDYLNFVATASFSPYAWDSVSGRTFGAYALNNDQGLGRFLNMNFSTTLLLAPKKSREKIKEENTKRNDVWNADFNYFALHPEEIIFFDIPWKMTMAHIYTIQANQNISSSNPNPLLFIQSLSIRGDVSFTKRWNLSGNINFNLEDKSITNANFSLNRNMHCWALSFYWTPIGGNKSFLLSIRNTSSIFRDAKIEIRKPPAFL